MTRLLARHPRSLLLAAFPAAASASSAQSMTFEAPRELLDAGDARQHAARRSATSASTASACSSTGSDYAPAPTPRRARLRRDGPRRLSGGHMGAPRRAVRRRRRRAASTVQLTLTGPGAALGDQAQARPRDAPEPEGVPGLRHRRRPPLRRPRRRVVDLERAQPPAVPAPAVRAEARRRRRASTASSSSRGAARPARVGQRRATRCCSARPRRAERRASSRRWRSCAARCA